MAKKFRKSSYGNSSWWMGEWDSDFDETEILTEKEIKSKNLYKLAAHKRAIANFVSIVTNQSIPVKFSSRGDSYTDGKSVVISSKINNPKEFDPSVGLALHEASHIKLTDFSILPKFESYLETEFGYMHSILLPLSKQKGIYLYSALKDILNWVEDRRIDNYVFSSSPGYRDYYRAMYDKYFNDYVVDKAMRSSEYTSEDFDSYMFRLINLHSKYTNLSALKGLRDIYETVDLKRISRLKSTKDSLEVALRVMEIMLNNIPDAQTQSSTETPQSQNGTGESGEEGASVSTSHKMGDEEKSNSTQNSENGEGESQTPAETETKPTETLTERQKGLLDKKIQKQKDFLNGEIKKTALSKKDLREISSIEESGADITVVGEGITNSWKTSKGVDCVVVKNMNQKLMESSNFPYAYQYYDGTFQTPSLKAVEDGIRLGTLLGKKLQTRSESRETVFNRQKIGRLDRRMISSIGFGNENVFFTKEVDQYKKANLHISIDASSSMNGGKWDKAITNVVALARAVDMISNLEIQISFRSTNRGDMPYIVMAYDSRKDKFSKVRKLFPMLYPSGTTPEGLAFEGIMKYMVQSNTDLDSYFLNISDGEPYYTTKEIWYMGQAAAKHTRAMTKKMENMGIKVLSYFVSDYEQSEDSSSVKIFRQSYGKAASFINVSNMVEVSRTVNKLFMEK